MTRYNFYRRLVAARIVNRQVYLFLSSILDFFMNLVHFEGKAGIVDFNPPTGDRLRPIDGYLIVREDGDGLGRTQIHFRCSNRWPIRNGRIPDRRYMLDVLSKALLFGHNASYIVWGDTALMPYDLRGVEQRFAAITPTYSESLLRKQLRVVEHQRELRISIGEDPDLPSPRAMRSKVRLFRQMVQA